MNRSKEAYMAYNKGDISKTIASKKNQKALEKYEQQVNNWDLQKEVASKHLNRSKCQSVITSSDQFRIKQEVNILLDKGQLIGEKYGDARGWKMGLRYDEDKDNGVLEYSENVGPLHQMIAYKIKDSRREPIEFVRRKDDEQFFIRKPMSKAAKTVYESQLEISEEVEIERVQKTEISGHT